VLTEDLSPEMIVGLTNVKYGFSIPPTANDGGITIMLYYPHRYGIYRRSALNKNWSASTNSHAHWFTMFGSLYTPIDDEICL